MRMTLDASTTEFVSGQKLCTHILSQVIICFRESSIFLVFSVFCTHQTQTTTHACSTLLFQQKSLASCVHYNISSFNWEKIYFLLNKQQSKPKATKMKISLHMCAGNYHHSQTLLSNRLNMQQK